MEIKNIQSNVYDIGARIKHIRNITHKKRQKTFSGVVKNIKRHHKKFLNHQPSISNFRCIIEGAVQSPPMPSAPPKNPPENLWGMTIISKIKHIVPENLYLQLPLDIIANCSMALLLEPS